MRMVLDNAGENDSQWAAIRSISEKFGCNRETLRVGEPSPEWTRCRGSPQSLKYAKLDLLRVGSWGCLLQKIQSRVMRSSRDASSP